MIDFELPKAIAACHQGLLEKIDPATLPRRRGWHAGGPGFRARRHRALLGGQHGLFPGDDLFATVCRRAPATPGRFFRHARNFPAARALSRASAKFNLEMALLADGVAPGDVYKTLETPEGLDRAFAKLDSAEADLGA